MTISMSQITYGGSSVDGATFDTTLQAMRQAKLNLCAVVSTVASGTPNAPTMTGGGYTWTQVATLAQGTSRLTLFRAYSTSAPTATNQIISFAGQTQIDCWWTMMYADRVVTTGSNGADAIVQSATNSTAGATSLVVSLGNFTDIRNGTFGVFFRANTGASFTAGSGFSYFAGGVALGEYKTGIDPTVDGTFSLSTAAIGIAIELKANVNMTVNATGVRQQVIIPDGVTSVDVELRGATGAPYVGTAGAGSTVRGTLATTPGETLNADLGQMGGFTVNGGWPNGGNAGTDPTGQSAGTGGGGSSTLFQGGTSAGNRVAVAGGGAGGSWFGEGGSAGHPTGGDGTYASDGTAGLGGTQSAGGAGGTNSTLGIQSGGAGAVGAGGNGGATLSAEGMGGPGGGGGYYGGGGGAASFYQDPVYIDGTDAGGGSDFDAGVMTGVSHAADWSGHGSLTLSWTPVSVVPPAIPPRNTTGRRGVNRSAVR